MSVCLPRIGLCSQIESLILVPRKAYILGVEPKEFRFEQLSTSRWHILHSHIFMSFWLLFTRHEDHYYATDFRICREQLRCCSFSKTSNCHSQGLVDNADKSCLAGGWGTAILRSLKLDPQGFIHLGGDGVARSLTKWAFFPERDRLIEIWAGVDGHDVANNTQIFHPGPEQLPLKFSNPALFNESSDEVISPLKEQRSCLPHQPCLANQFCRTIGCVVCIGSHLTIQGFCAWRLIHSSYCRRWLSVRFEDSG